MRITKHERLFQLTMMPNFFPINCYLFEEDDYLILVDAALKSAAPLIIQTAKESGKPIQKIILTHVHSDHIGALDEVKKAYPEAKLYVSKREAPILEGDVSMLPFEPQSKIRGGLPKGIQTKPDVLIQDCDVIGALQVISTPGHTPGSISLYDQDKHILIAGDALVTKGGLAVTGAFKWSFPFPAFATWDHQTALKSAETLLSLNISCLATGHGDLLFQPQVLLKKAVEKRKRQLGKGAK
ncbi:MBL fold metallo-hydrolase [Bacillus sp. NPDC077027]|uniref:MBL fold metallo-hydrolase n=1 Tax=Bacillus sp. NPDC077027 TaxID=3390548 RepID=UPI003CFF2DC1